MRTLRVMSAHPNPSIAALGAAVRDGVAGRFAPIEGAWIKHIEHRRDELLNNHNEIQYTDYGAGSTSPRNIVSQPDENSTTTLTVSKMCEASRPPFWGGILFRLIREFRPVTCIELGTCLGISGSYQAAALRMNSTGSLRTLEGSAALASLAEETFELLGVENTTVVPGPFRETLVDVLKAAGPVDYMFNDGHHDRDAVLEYFEKSLPYLSNQAIMVFDDINWSPGMRDAWKTIKADPRVAETVDLRQLGIALIGDYGLDHKVNYHAPL